MELRDYTRIVWRYWIVVLAVAVAGLLTGTVYSLVQPIHYTATAQVLVKVSGNESPSEDAALAQQVATTYVELATSSDTLEPVIDELGLTQNPAQLAASLRAAVAAGNRIIQVSAASTSAAQGAATATAVAESLSARIQAEYPQDVTAEVVPAIVPRTGTGLGRLAMNAMACFFVGIVLGLALAGIVDAARTRVRTAREVMATTGIRVVAAISRPRRGIAQSGLDPDDLRSLRTSLQAIRQHHGPSIALIPLTDDPGMPRLAVALARSLAEADERPLLIDADLRRPGSGAAIGAVEFPGLAEVLAGVSIRTEAAQPSDDGFDILPAGQPAKDSRDLLASARVDKFDADARKDYDIVLYLAPPVTGSSDATALARRLGSAIVFVPAGRVRLDQFARSVRALDQAGIRISGVVITDAPTSGPDAIARWSFKATGADAVSRPQVVDRP